MMREGFIVYRSFVEALQELSDEDFGKLMRGVCAYGLDGEIPDLSGIQKALFELMRPQIDANNRRYENGKKGGRPSEKNQTETKTKPNHNQTETKVKPNHNQTITKPKPKEKDKEKEKDKDKGKENIYSSPAASDTLSETEKVFEDLWSMYPNKRGKSNVKMASKKEIAKIGLEEMTRAVERYVTELETDSWRQPQNGNTFFNRGYIDYLDANYEPRKEAPKKAEAKVNRFVNFPQRQWDFDEMERMEAERRDKELMSG